MVTHIKIHTRCQQQNFLRFVIAKYSFLLHLFYSIHRIINFLLRYLLIDDLCKLYVYINC